jgi:hypothetical protein
MNNQARDALIANLERLAASAHNDAHETTDADAEYVLVAQAGAYLYAAWLVSKHAGLVQE